MSLVSPGICKQVMHGILEIWISQFACGLLQVLGPRLATDDRSVPVIRIDDLDELRLHDITQLLQVGFHPTSNENRIRLFKVLHCTKEAIPGKNPHKQLSKRRCVKRLSHVTPDMIVSFPVSVNKTFPPGLV